MQYLLVFIGGGLGSLARFFTSLFAAKYFSNSFPYATLLSNSISTLLLGCLMGYLLGKSSNEQLRLFIAVGFCGGFSTFSTFSAETFELIKSGNILLACTNIAFNIISCFVLLGIGYKTFAHQ